MKIILGGAPHSGKSCLRFALKEAFKALGPATPYPYVITACPDGEGAWYHETSSTNPRLAQTLKNGYKSKFTDEHAQRFASEVQNCKLPLTFIDIGGRIDDKNRNICQHATHAILMAGRLEDLPPWRGFCEELNLTIFAELHSHYDGTEDLLPVLAPDGVYRGSIHHLERGDTTLHLRPTVQALAQLILQTLNPPTASFL